jgi:hypothetical protein
MRSQIRIRVRVCEQIVDQSLIDDESLGVNCLGEKDTLPENQKP